MLPTLRSVGTPGLVGTLGRLVRQGWLVRWVGWYVGWVRALGSGSAGTVRAMIGSVYARVRVRTLSCEMSEDGVQGCIRHHRERVHPARITEYPEPKQCTAMGHQSNAQPWGTEAMHSHGSLKPPWVTFFFPTMPPENGQFFKSSKFLNRTPPGPLA